MANLEIQEGKPPKPGIYVVYVNDDFCPTSAGRELLLWHENAWWYRLSTVKYRGHVYGWIGPLPILKLEGEDK